MEVRCAVCGGRTTKAARARYASVISSGIPDVFGGPVCQDATRCAARVRGEAR